MHWINYIRAVYKPKKCNLNYCGHIIYTKIVLQRSDQLINSYPKQMRTCGVWKQVKNFAQQLHLNIRGTIFFFVSFLFFALLHSNRKGPASIKREWKKVLCKYWHRRITDIFSSVRVLVSVVHVLRKDYLASELISIICSFRVISFGEFHSIPFSFLFLKYDQMLILCVKKKKKHIQSRVEQWNC